MQSVRISGTRRHREDDTGQEYTAYLIDSVLSVHGVQTTLRSERRYKHFNLLDELLRLAQLLKVVDLALAVEPTEGGARGGRRLAAGGKRPDGGVDKAGAGGAGRVGHGEQ